MLKLLIRQEASDINTFFPCRFIEMVPELVQHFLGHMLDAVLTLVSQLPVFSLQEGRGPFGIDTSIEGMKSQEFSVGIFYFLIASIVVFTVFVLMYMTKGKTANLKKGEKILFVWILLGIVTAVIFGAAQMLHGYLF